MEDNEEERVAQEAIAQGEEPVCIFTLAACDTSDTNYRHADANQSRQLETFMGTSVMF
jgi:hypothetical protein